MPRLPGRCFAGFAFTLTWIAFGFALLAVAQRYLQHARFVQQPKRARCAFEAQAADEVGQRLAGYGRKDAMEMERGKSRDCGELLKRKLLDEMPLDAVDGAVDTPFVFAAMQRRRRVRRRQLIFAGIRPCVANLLCSDPSAHAVDENACRTPDCSQ
jgi:hypothetical protein